MLSDEEISDLVESSLKIALDHFSKKNYEVAAVILDQTLKVDPNNTQSLQLMGVTMHALQRNDEARKHLEKCLEIEPQNPDTINNLALSQARVGNYRQSIQLLEKALAIKPESCCLLSNMGLQYKSLGDFDRAIDCFKQSLLVKEQAATYAMIGGTYGEMLRLDDAKHYISEAIRLDPEFGAAHVDMATVLHLQGQHIEGFAEYEWRLKVYDQHKYWNNVYEPSKAWDGSDPSGKIILVHAEQGNGDTIQFARYLPRLRQAGARVVFHCPEVLRSMVGHLANDLYTQDPAVMQTWEKRREKNEDGVPDHDYHVFLLSLPHLLGLGIINDGPYLSANKAFDMSKYRGKKKVAIAWAGNPQHPNDKSRSCRLELFQGIHDTPDVQLFSIMKDTRQRKYHDCAEPIDLSAGNHTIKAVDMSGFMETYADTAAILKSIDVVVAVDTSIIHLAGAMGVPAVCLVAHNPDWRWGLSGERTVWYDSVTVARQRRPGDWISAFEKAECILKKFGRG